MQSKTKEEQSTRPSAIVIKSDSCTIPRNFCKKDDDNYISRIYKNTEQEQNEEEISKTIIEKVKKPNYYYFFSPVLESCFISLQELDGTGCEKPTTGNEQFKSFRIKKNGDKTIQQKIEEIAKTCKPIILYRFLLDQLIYLLHSIELLNQENIIHTNLDSKTIMYNEEANIPIVTNLGKAYADKQQSSTSFLPSFFSSKEETTPATKSKSKSTTQLFVKPQKTFEDWLYTQLEQKQQRNNEPEITKEELEKLSTNFFNHDNSLFKQATEEERNQIKQKYQDLFKDKTKIDEIKQICLQTKTKWNEYAILVTFYLILSKEPEWIPEQRHKLITKFKSIIMKEENKEEQEKTKSLKEYFINELQETYK